MTITSRPMTELPPGSVLLTDYPDRVGRVRYALSPDGQVWRIEYGAGLPRSVELPRPIKPVMMGAKGKRRPHFKIKLPGKHGSGAVSLAGLMAKHFPEKA